MNSLLSISFFTKPYPCWIDDWHSSSSIFSMVEIQCKETLNLLLQYFLSIDVHWMGCIRLACLNNILLIIYQKVGEYPICEGGDESNHQHIVYYITHITEYGM